MGNHLSYFKTWRSFCIARANPLTATGSAETSSSEIWTEASRTQDELSASNVLRSGRNAGVDIKQPTL